jgi:type 2 lantibiotic biosynthesis protein LanM
MSSYPVDPRFAERPAAGFIKLVDAQLDAAWLRLQEALRPLGGAPFDRQSAARLFVNVPNDVLWMLERTLVFELDRARRQDELAGASTSERYDDFIDQLARADTRARLWSRHPLLAQLVTRRIELVVEATIELARRLMIDWPRLCRRFDVPPTATLSGARMWDGGSHRGGRSLTRLEFAGRYALVYAPRSLAAQAGLYDALEWLNGRGVAAPFRARRFLLVGDHGWAEEVTAFECADDAEIVRFHRRQGGQLALLHLLHCSGMSYRNVIAAGEQPMLVDVERLFTSGPEGAPLHELAHVGLLPLRAWALGGGEGVDVGALGDPEGVATVRPRPALVDVRTDRMRFARVAARWGGADNRPRVGGGRVAAARYVAPLVDGFVEVYDLVRANRRDLIRPDGPLASFADAEVRVALHDASLYVALLLEGTHPQVLADVATRDRFFRQLDRARPRLPAELAAAARQALSVGDAPLFSTTPASRTLDAGPVSVDGFFAESAMNVVRRRIAGMSDVERDRCVREIVAAFRSLPAV